MGDSCALDWLHAFLVQYKSSRRKRELPTALESLWRFGFCLRLLVLMDWESIYYYRK